MIAELIDKTGEARLTDLARGLGVTHVTANRTIKRLQRKGLVTSQPYRSIFLTTDGRSLAKESRDRHETVVRFLMALGVPVSRRGIGRRRDRAPRQPRNAGRVCSASQDPDPPLTQRRRAHTLNSVRRSLASTLVASVLLFGLRASGLHVHAYVDHDHEEHHHSPAIHDHDADAGEPDEVPHVSACDPASHIVRVAYAASPTTDVHPVAGDLAVTALPLRALNRTHAVQLLDVRGHGPPPARSYSLRAPPLQTLL